MKFPRRLIKLVLVAASLPLLSGCVNPISAWLLKRKAAQATATAQAVQASTDKLQAGYEKDRAANQAVINNLKAQMAAEQLRHEAVDTYVAGADQVLTAQEIDDTAKVSASRILVSYAKQNGDPLTAKQLAWLTPIIAQLVAKDKADIAAGQKALADALAGKQVALDAERKVETNLVAQTTVLEKAKAGADAQVTTVTQQWQKAEAKVTAQVASANTWLNKYSVLKSTIYTAFWTVITIIAVGALLAIGAILYPPLYPISKFYRFLVGETVKLIFMPIHWLYDWIETKREPPLPAAVQPAPVPAPVQPKT